jgi:adenosylmethionine-8-amino-7-oxononanoate aminotransferase
MMGIKKLTGTPYHLWNAYTPMDIYMTLFGYGFTVITRGEGHYIYNLQGKKLINGNSSLWNFALGYGREEIIEAAERQMREMAFSPTWGQAHPRAIELAAKLVELTKGHYQHVYLGSNGSEAVETAIKMARQYHRQSRFKSDRGRYKIISLRKSYHGYAYGAVSASADEDIEKKFGPLVPGFLQIDPPYCYRCPFGKKGYPECGLACAEALEVTILREGPQTVAAFLFEPIMGEAGVIIPPEEYYLKVAEICRKYGALLIADEVTTGFGRAGKLFVSQDWELRPDILCLGKIIGGGYLPLSATLATKDIYRRFLGSNRHFKHGSTHSGHPVCAAVGLAAIDIIQSENLVENSARVGAYLKTGLQKIAENNPLVGEVRGSGLMAAVELVKNRETKQPFSAEETRFFLFDLVNRGLLISLDDYRMLPPLNYDKAIIDDMLAIIQQNLQPGILADLERKSRLVKEVLAAKLNGRANGHRGSVLQTETLHETLD